MRNPSSSARMGDSSDMKPETTAEGQGRLRAHVPLPVGSVRHPRRQGDQGGRRTHSKGQREQAEPLSSGGCPSEPEALPSPPHFNEENPAWGGEPAQTPEWPWGGGTCSDPRVALGRGTGSDPSGPGEGNRLTPQSGPGTRGPAQTPVALDTGLLHLQPLLSSLFRQAGSNGLMCCSFWAKTTCSLGTKEAGGLCTRCSSAISEHSMGSCSAEASLRGRSSVQCGRPPRAGRQSKTRLRDRAAAQPSPLPRASP